MVSVIVKKHPPDLACITQNVSIPTLGSISTRLGSVCINLNTAEGRENNLFILFIISDFKHWEKKVPHRFIHCCERQEKECSTNKTFCSP